jgi:quercetin dioxygenase-like cupin family protein
MMILEGEGEFLGGTQPVRVKKGDVLVCDIAEPHGLMAITDLRLLVTIAPPI